MQTTKSTRTVNQRFKNRLIKSSLLLLLLLILLFPSIAFAGARNGLLLWWDTLLPTLLPFMILSSLIIRLRITRPLSAILYPLFRRFLPITKAGCYPVFIGFLAGVPIGAKTTADLYTQGTISTREAQMLCAFTNNASPMFVLSFITGVKLGIPKLGIPLLLILFLSSYLSSILWYYLIRKKESKHIFELSSTEFFPSSDTPSFTFHLIDDSILCAFEVVTKVGGYIVLFSVLASFVSNLPFHLGPAVALITGLLEITTGIDRISCLTIATELKVVMVVGITAFGGLCLVAQTKSVLSETGLSTVSYIICKMLSAGIAILLSLIYVQILS